MTDKTQIPIERKQDLPDLGADSLPVAWLQNIPGRANELLEVVDAIGEFGSGDPQVPERMTATQLRYHAYALLHCCHLSETAPPGQLLHLMYKLLKVHPKDSPVPPIHERHHAFVQAALFESRYPEDTTSLDATAEHAGVSRAAIREWRNSADYRELVSFMRTSPKLRAD